MNKTEWITAILEVVKPYLNERDFEQVTFKTVVLMQEEMEGSDEILGDRLSISRRCIFDFAKRMTRWI